MTTCTVTPTLAAPLGARFLEAFLGWFSHSLASREAADQAWLDSGLGRLDAATLEDIGAPPQLTERARLRQAWQLAAALDATRHF